MYRCTRKKGTIHVHVLVVHVHGECSVRLPIGIEILRCVILGRLLVEHVDKSQGAPDIFVWCGQTLWTDGRMAF